MYAYRYRGVMEYNNFPITGNLYGDYFLDKYYGIQYYWSKFGSSGDLDDWEPLSELAPMIVADAIYFPEGWA